MEEEAKALKKNAFTWHFRNIYHAPISQGNPDGVLKILTEISMLMNKSLGWKILDQPKLSCKCFLRSDELFATGVWIWTLARPFVSTTILSTKAYYEPILHDLFFGDGKHLCLFWEKISKKNSFGGFL